MARCDTVSAVALVGRALREDAFIGHKCTNETHGLTTDPYARLCRKSYRKALLRRPSLNQLSNSGKRVVQREPLLTLVTFGKEPLCRFRRKQMSAILREHRVVLHCFAHAQPYEPARLKILVDLRYQLPFRTAQKEHL